MFRRFQPSAARSGIASAAWRVVPRGAALRTRRFIVARRVMRGQQAETDIRALPAVVAADDACWDIGANAGSYSLALSALCERVEAFEPIPHNRDILRDVLRRRGVGNVTVHAVAVCDRVGAAAMRMPDAADGGFYTAALAADGGIPVQASTIDALVAGGLRPPALIKCDVEGAEDQVISGALGLIARRHPIWLVETFADGVFARMLGLGYEALVFERRGRFERVTSRLESARNYWFVPPALAARLAGT